MQMVDRQLSEECVERIRKMEELIMENCPIIQTEREVEDAVEEEREVNIVR